MAKQENVGDIKQCQSICRKNKDCGFFVFKAAQDSERSTCEMYQESAKTNRSCEFVHGTVEPDFTKCIDDKEIPWEKAGKFR